MTPPAGDPPEKDQSMDDILASIRRIMLDEQARLQDSPGAPARPPADPVLILDASMVVEDKPAEHLTLTLVDETVVMVSTEAEAQTHVQSQAQTHAHTGAVPLEVVSMEEIEAPHHTPGIELPAADGAAVDVPLPVSFEPGASEQSTVPGAVHGLGTTDPVAQQIVVTSQAIEALLAPAAAAAAAASVEALLKQLNEDRLAALQPRPLSSPTIDEVVRAELRPYLKAWLDEHLPTMVERLVKAEINRLIGRIGA
jgi:uncharacterized protein